MSSTSDEDTPTARTDKDGTKSQTKDEPSGDEEAIQAILDALDKEPGNESLAQALKLLYLREQNPQAFDKFIEDADAAAARSAQSTSQHTALSTLQPVSLTQSATRSGMRPRSPRVAVPPVTPPLSRPSEPSRLRMSTSAPTPPTPVPNINPAAPTTRDPSATASSQVAGPRTQDQTPSWLDLPSMADEQVDIPFDLAHSGARRVRRRLQDYHPHQVVTGPRSQVYLYMDLWHVAHRRAELDPARTVIDLAARSIRDLSDDEVAERSRRRISGITSPTSR